jgi:hypothetical protein
MRKARLRIQLPAVQPRASLCDTLDQLLDTGVVVAGELFVKVADVELLYVALELVACSYDKAARVGMSSRSVSRAPRGSEVE